MLIKAIQRSFESCLRAAAVFERDVPGKQLFEADVLRKAGHDWLALGAGLDAKTAASIFPVNSSRAERAATPLRTTSGAQASLLFVVRPCEFPTEKHSPLRQLAMFAPAEGVPMVEIREAFFRIEDLPDNPNQIRSLRWEIDVTSASKQPLETWLTAPARVIGYNPAHCPSHLHINSMLQEDGQGRPVESHADLRFGCGPANPLAVILSIAAWLRAN